MLRLPQQARLAQRRGGRALFQWVAGAPNRPSRPAARPCPHRPSAAAPSPPPHGCASAGRRRGSATFVGAGFPAQASGRVMQAGRARRPRPYPPRAPSPRPTPPPRKTPGNTPACSPARRPGRGRPSGGTAPRRPGRRQPRPAPGCRVGRGGWSGRGGRAPSRRQGDAVSAARYSASLVITRDPPSTALDQRLAVLQQQLRPLRRHIFHLEIPFQQLRRASAPPPRRAPRRWRSVRSISFCSEATKYAPSSARMISRSTTQRFLRLAQLHDHAHDRLGQVAGALIAATTAAVGSAASRTSTRTVTNGRAWRW